MGRPSRLAAGHLCGAAGKSTRPAQAGLADHYRACAAAAAQPVIIYDIPGRTGRKVATKTLIDLLESVDNIIGIKDAAGDPGETARLLSLAPSGTEVYSGDDNLTLPFLSVGAVGTIGVATHWVGNETKAMMEAFFDGDVERAIGINRALMPSYAFETGDEAPNPVPTKAMMRVMGLPGGPTRPPMGPEPAWLQGEAEAVLAGLGRG